MVVQKSSLSTGQVFLATSCHYYYYEEVNLISWLSNQHSKAGCCTKNFFQSSMQIQLITKDHHFLHRFAEICIQFETTAAAAKVVRWDRAEKVYHEIFASSTNVPLRLLTSTFKVWFSNANSIKNQKKYILERCLFHRVAWKARTIVARNEAKNQVSYLFVAASKSWPNSTLWLDLCWSCIEGHIWQKIHSSRTFRCLLGLAS